MVFNGIIDIALGFLINVVDWRLLRVVSPQFEDVRQNVGSELLQLLHSSVDKMPSRKGVSDLSC